MIMALQLQIGITKQLFGISNNSWTSQTSNKMNDTKSAAGVWKTFDANTITHSSAHHLMAIHELIDQRGYARVTDVAKHLGISRGSASVTLKTLKSKGYVAEDDNRFLHLTSSGKELVQSVAVNRSVLIKFLRDVLAVDAGQAEIDACKVEHLLSPETGGRLLHFLEFLFSEDHRAAAFISAFRSVEPSPTEERRQNHFGQNY
jgi:Mn-dependent DtxR family transcriptional regulator